MDTNIIRVCVHTDHNVALEKYNAPPLSYFFVVVIAESEETLPRWPVINLDLCPHRNGQHLW